MQLPGKPAEHEPLARYLLERSKFTPSSGRVKTRAFLPPPDGELSVYRTDGLTHAEIRSTGANNVARPDKPILAWAHLLVSNVDTASLGTLSVRADPPPSRHACITGWPDESATLLLAQQLAAVSTLCVA
jgi:hypothetical protein